jgi:hypothetical protein
VAKDYESTPTMIIANLQEQKAFIKGTPEFTIQTAVKGTKMELALPLKILPVTEQGPFYVNVIRKVGGHRLIFWRGTVLSCTEPVTYQKFMFQ